MNVIQEFTRDNIKHLKNIFEAFMEKINHDP